MSHLAVSWQPSRGWWYPLTSGLHLCDRAPPDVPDDVRVLVLDQGQAFPLGHPTTRLCLDLLVPALAAVPVQRLVEIGCGNGVLCIAAALLGVPLVLGLDIAPPAVQASRSNVRRQQLDETIQIIQGSSSCLTGSFDLVVANLPCEVQQEQVEYLCRLAAGGRLLLSGFRESDEGQLLAQYRQRGWQLSQRAVKYFSHPELPAYLNFNWVAWLLAAGEAAS
ncbi:MAG: 50S ribosomal protein L11 methyltransferase [Desulfobacca sp.]|uniref:50S ribosomal protein L11 methyltransferase n=1 Tax=Desulfobacca sp. TaxID=2067990 RepID=UPI00404A36DD